MEGAFWRAVSANGRQQQGCGRRGDFHSTRACPPMAAINRHFPTAILVGICHWKIDSQSRNGGGARKARLRHSSSRRFGWGGIFCRCWKVKDDDVGRARHAGISWRHVGGRARLALAVLHGRGPVDSPHGRRMEMVRPTGAAGAAMTFPPHASRQRLTIARPSPAPPVVRWRAASGR